MSSRALVSSDEEAYLYATQLTSSSIPTMALKVAIELDLLEIIAKAGPEGRMSAIEIASHLPATNPDAPEMVDRILGVLATSSIVTCCLRTLPTGTVERTYSLAPVCKYLTRNEDGVSLAASHLFVQSKMLLESWCYLKNAILEGGMPWKKCYGMNIFESIAQDPESTTTLNRGMHDNTIILMKKMLENYHGFEEIESLVNVGGGLGIAIHLIVSKYPNVKGINFDLPHVIAQAPTYQGVEHVGGDMFASIPRSDAVFIMRVCHNWSDDHCLKLFKNCYDALPADGKVILMEYLLPQVPDCSMEHKFIFNLDAMMMAITEGGRERTQHEFEVLAKRAGFQELRVPYSFLGLHAMEMMKGA